MRLLLLGTGAWLSGCGSAGHLEGQVFHGQDATYRVGHLGSDWKRLDVEGQNDLAFALPSQAAIIQVNASCDPALDIPLEALTKHLLIGFTDRDVRSQERVPMAAREALRTHATAKMDGVPRELIFHVLKKDGCVYDFALVAPPGERFTQAREAYEGFVGGFETRRRSE
ncbi:MAG: hypothetical protein ACOCV4_02300 [Myxococcota bacterium]